MHIHLHMQAITMKKKKEAMNLKDSKESLEVGKGKEKCNYFISKI